MPNLTPVSSFDDVPELETSTLALGGPGGPMNLPAQALLNRTQWLRDNAVAGSSSPYAAAAATANAITATYTPAITATADGLKLRFAAAAANTGPATFAPNALTAAPVLGQAGLALQGGEIAANGEVEVTWSSALNAWVMTACTGGAVQVADATASHHAASKSQLDAVSSVASAAQTTANAAAPSADLASTAAGKGASLIGFTQAGVGAAARTLQDKARETCISVKDFGAVGDGAADDTAAFNAAVTYCASRNGGQILVPAGTYKITSMITVSDSDIVFVGEGFDTFHDAGSMAHNTLINWAGAAGVDAVFLFTSIAGATNKCLAGCGVLDLAIIGGDSVKSCVELRSHREGRFRFFGGYCTDYILKMGVVSQLGEAEDTQSNVVELWGRQFSTGGSGIGLFGNGNNPPNANTSFNQFKYVDLQINTGTGIVFGNCDTNIFEIVRVIGVTTGKAYEFQGSNLNTSDTARGNWVKFLSSQGPGYSRGTTSYTYAAVGNSIGLDTGNGTPYPTIETGSTCYYTAGFVQQQWMPAFARATLAADVPAANNERANVSGETLRVHSGSSNHIRITDGTTVWGINMTGGDLRIHLLAGTGTFRFGSFTSNADAAINGYVTIKDANGNIRKLATIA